MNERLIRGLDARPIELMLELIYQLTITGRGGYPRGGMTPEEAAALFPGLNEAIHRITQQLRLVVRADPSAYSHDRFVESVRGWASAYGSEDDLYRAAESALDRLDL